jgi:4-amino-4-deoxy-L-arabinose transferase-like glycosyltransferase
LAGRRTNAVVGALVVVLAFAITTMLTNRVGGVATGLFLAFHPLHITLSTQALSDELLALTLAIAFAAAFRYVRSPGYGWALAMGLAIGVGGGTKLAPLALSFVLAGYGGVWLLWKLRSEGRATLGWANGRFGYLLIAQPIIAGITFVAMYPYLWVSPIRNSLNLLDFRRTEMASQARIWTHASVENPLGAFRRYGEQLHGAYSSTRDVQVWIAERLGMENVRPESFDLILVAIGAILITRIVIQRGLWSPHALVATLMAAELGAVTLGLGVDFYRYYLPVLLINSVLVGVAFGEVYGSVLKLSRGNTEPAVLAEPERSHLAQPSAS